MLLDDENDWNLVRKGSAEGYVHQSAIDDDPVGVKSASILPSFGASNDEVSLAAKGFDANIESSYRKNNPALRFDRLAQMERRSVSSSTLVKFMKDGKLLQ